jgi:hypothetical protein
MIMSYQLIPPELIASDLIKYVIIPYLDNSDIRIILDFKSVDQIGEALSLGIDIHSYNEYALQSASANGHLEVVRILLKNGADLHAGDDYALQSASRNGQLEVVRLLLKNGARLDSLDWPMRSDIIKRLRF